MDNEFTILYKKIAKYEQYKITMIRKGILIGFPAILFFLSLGIYIFSLGGYLFGSTLIFLMSLMLWTYTKELIEFKKRKKIHKLFFTEFYNNDIIDNILLKISSIAPILEKSIKQRNAFQKANLRINYLENLLQYLLIILLDLRSDLTIRITEQQKLLEGAKSEVETNIQGTTELELVSELQKTRLDRQIEQFEELQRVLVKV